ncbi:Sjogrens syndrome scleroderma autoantigen 1 [Haloterrigena turkmenica DSM 5511]|uniref:Sjogrens syndrome scleroderma autoantigen 1 n=1 Tax=Haloterrigena turkmenica (strain ATCC 51198 / DSM 5511 / JCM 9101 / NCIMB 13204 / VKM B-1734 / 4k) TaxID=543526 RepID=D2RRX1_HALTV|nr:Sjogren's syndrome/scleroderma autoantigen 1 family protein [Haloterrigena turkmenica]ADB62588.1 Sjogrens syndrome scleroderma autoantigen 1 [Haloterrigena turkmenica DSM 5511]
MSDFDKEAEREKLREKYERDQEERQATQRMSDLLLKGATMTNAHCGTCGDPLFQMDGTTFCPSCHGNPDAVEGTQLEAQSAEDAADEAPNGTAADREPSRQDSSPAAGGSETVETSETDTPAARQDRQRGQQAGSTDAIETADSSPAADETAATERNVANEEQPTAASAGDRQPSTARSASTRSTDADRERSARSPADDRRSIDGAGAGGAARSADGDLEAARDSLVAALEKFAGNAAATDDPRYARECLEAAHEAAETLETLR